MQQLTALERRRECILEEIRAIRTMRKGSVSEQYLKVYHKGAKEPALRGPYWVYTRKEQGKTVSQRLSSTEAEQLRKGVGAYHQFQALCREYVEITEKIGELTREQRVVPDKKNDRGHHRKR